LWQPDCNVIWDLATHDVSIILYLLEQEPVSVCAKGAWHVDEGKEDVAFITLTFPNKKVCHLHVSWLDPLKVRKTVVVGSKKMVVYDDVEPIEKLKIYDKSVAKHDSYATFGEFQMSYNYGDAHIPRISSTEPLKIECKHFLECIRNKKKPRSDGESGLRVVKVLEAAEESIKNDGKEVMIK
jgi:predicted dehydrogenase